LTVCYTGQGWAIEEQALLQSEATPGQASLGFTEIKLGKPAYRSGYLLFCQFTEDGVLLEPRRGGAWVAAYRHGTTVRRWLDRLHGTANLPREDPPGPVYQLQLFTESYTPLTPAQQAEGRALFVHGLQVLRRHWSRPD